MSALTRPADNRAVAPPPLSIAAAVIAALSLIALPACTSDTGSGDGANMAWTDDCSVKSVTSNSINGTLKRDAEGRLLAVGDYSFTYTAGKLSAIQGPNDRDFTVTHDAGKTMRATDWERFTYTFDSDGRITDVTTEVRTNEGAPLKLHKQEQPTWDGANVTKLTTLNSKGKAYTPRTYTYSATANPLADIDPVILHTITRSLFLSSASFIAKEQGSSWTNTYTATLGNDRYVTAVSVKLDGLGWTPLADARFVYACR